MKTVFLSTAAIAVAFFATTLHAGAQTKDCECINGVKVITVNGVQETTNIPCEGSFTADPKSVDQTKPFSVTATPTVISSVIPSALFGNVTISLDLHRPAAPTTIRSNGDAPFPATVDLNFNVIATTDDGVAYENVQPFEYRSENANSYDPFQQETLTLVSDVDFVPQGGGEVAFTVNRGSTFTLVARGAGNGR
jgi:hypothetical protein